MKDKKCLIVYYSHSGNTKCVAEKIRSLTDSEIFSIDVACPYPNAYSSLVEEVKKEIEVDFKPQIKPIDFIIQDYDVIFLGTPVWWYTISLPLKSFLMQNNFSGKFIVPFCTHGGGGESSTFRDVKKYALNAKVLDGLSVYMRNFSSADISVWLDKITLDIDSDWNNV